MSDYPAFTDPTKWTPQIRERVNLWLDGRPLMPRHCVRRGHPDPMPVVPGTELCVRCHNTFRLIVGVLAEDWPDLIRSVLRHPGQGYSEKVDTSGHGDASSLWNPAATAAERAITDWAGFLTRTIVRDCPLPEPTTRTDMVRATTAPTWDDAGHRTERLLTEEERTHEFVSVKRTDVYSHGIARATRPHEQLAAIARWHARWLTGYPTLGAQLVDDALRFKEMVTNALNSTGVRRIEVRDAYCSDVVEETDLGQVLCNGKLAAILRPEDDRQPSVILCTTDPAHSRYPAEEWILAR